jgi:hypothetical protein
MLGRQQKPFGVLLVAAGMILLGLTGSAGAAYRGGEPLDLPVDKARAGTFALDGEFVHNVGELQMNITNWGLLGSRPGGAAAYSDAPSAMWPAGSGIEYLWAAGLWVGALKNGVPLVTTGQYAPEMLANPDDPLDTIWPTYQGAAGGKRFPDPGEDDDGDGRIDEDPINGLDDDNDTLVDEDFGAISNQMFRATMRDNTALVVEINPEHEPLNLRIIQQSYAWENDDVDDFIGFQFEMVNVGVQPLEDMYVGFFADCDIGPRNTGGIAEDDLPGFFDGSVRAADNSLVPISVAYMYDCDGDGGLAPGFIGIMFLDHPIDPSGEIAPQRVGITSFNHFSGNQPFDRGGDPNNDAERYELLSADGFDQTPPLGECGKANDFRILLATGPFVELPVDESLVVRSAIVVGAGETGLKQHAADAALTYYGAFFDKDLDPSTGIEGRENEICAEDFGSSASDPTNPIFSLFSNPCDTLGLGAGGEFPPPIDPSDLDDDGCIFVNSDCYFELARRNGANNCVNETTLPPEQLGGCTGVQGKEFPVRWLVGLAPVAPDLRLWQTDNRTHVFFNNMSQIIPDVRLQEIDFESYRIWRADGWDRPFGASIDNGPEASLWSLIAEFDVVNFFQDRREVDGQVIVQELPLGANTGLDVIQYTPQMFRPEHPEYEATMPEKELVQTILEDPAFEFLNATLAPSEFVRYRDKNGQITPIGAKYPQIRDFEDSYDAIDSAYWGFNGVEFFEFVDEDVFNGVAYFYSVTATDFVADTATGEVIPIGRGLAGDPQSNFGFAVPRFTPQTAEERDELGQNIFVFPNPATREALADFSQFNPNSDDPTGVRVMFANLPAARNTINIYTLAGDLVETLEHDGTALDCPDDSGFGNCGGSAFWNLVSRNGQEVVSGIYLYSVESSDAAFDRVIGRFVVVR